MTRTGHTGYPPAAPTGHGVPSSSRHPQDTGWPTLEGNPYVWMAAILVMLLVAKNQYLCVHISFTQAPQDIRGYTQHASKDTGGPPRPLRTLGGTPSTPQRTQGVHPGPSGH